MPLDAAGAERRIARHIAYELEARGWSYGDLAREMKDTAHVEVRRQAIEEMLRPHRPRRIRVDEYLAIAQALGVDARRLLRPIEEVADEEVGRAADSLAAATERLDDVFNEYVTAALDYHDRVRQTADGSNASLRMRVREISAQLSRGEPAGEQRFTPRFTIRDGRIDSLEAAEWAHGDASGPWSGLRGIFSARLPRLGVGTREREDIPEVPELNALRRALAREGDTGARFQILHACVRYMLWVQDGDGAAEAAAAAAALLGAIVRDAGIHGDERPELDDLSVRAVALADAWIAEVGQREVDAAQREVDEASQRQLDGVDADGMAVIDDE
ncbi:hypothetical protein [Demequina sp. SO4-18]|uniref:hypothetical protein n=1 Tax=Demequina sp. SO4-18 TaxID=3401026 RepID=UPI003B5A661C